MAYFKNFKTELKVAKAIKVVEATLFLIVSIVLGISYYNGASFIHTLLALYALFLSYQLSRELQSKRHYSKINISWTIGVIFYSVIVLSETFLLFSNQFNNALLISIIILWVANYFGKKLSDVIFYNFNLVATIGQEMSKLTNEEFEEYSKKLNGVFKDIEDEIEKMAKENIDETTNIKDEQSTENQT